VTFDLANLVTHQGNHASQSIGDWHGGIVNDARNRAHRRASAGRQQHALLAQDASHRVDSCRSRRHPLIAETMQGDHGLLGDTLDGHHWQLSRAHRFKQRLSVRTVRLVSAHVGPHVGGRQ
jgi:hypothetical protein